MSPQTIDILILGMDGGDLSVEDCVRVRVSLAVDSDDWDDEWGHVDEGGRGAGIVAVSGVGVVDELTATCRWGSRGATGGMVSVGCVHST